jgi:LacI family transcriptional regulator
MPAEKLPITIRDVAAAAGVSAATVSRVLSGSVPVTAERRAAVLSAVSRLNFHPSLTAQGLARGRSWEIGVMAQGIASSFYALMLAEIADVLRGSGYQPVFAEGSAELVIGALDTFMRRNVDALIVVGGQTPDRLLLDVAARMPLVAVARTIAGREGQCLQVSSVEGARAATRHLLELGHRRIAHVMGIPSHEHSAERLAGYRQALAEAGVRYDPALVVTGDFEETSGYEALQALFRRRLRFSAVFAGNDQMAYGALLALYRRGLRVPQDVSVVGFDDQRGASFTTPPLTTVRQPAAQMGRAAAEGALRVLRGEPLALPTFATELVVRESTARFRPLAARPGRSGVRVARRAADR